MGLFSWLFEDDDPKADSTDNVSAKLAKGMTKAIETAKASATDSISKSAASTAEMMVKEKIDSSKKADETSISKKAARKAKKKKFEWRDVKEPIKFVNQNGKILCPFCNVPIGDFLVTSTQVKLQDTLYVTAGDRIGAPMPNLIFKGLCMYPCWGITPPPCISVIQPGMWKDTSQTIIDFNQGLLRKSTIPCMISQQDISIVHSGQKAWLDQLKPKTEPEVKRIKMDFKELVEGSMNDGSGGTQYGMIYGKEYHFEVKEFCENLEPTNENTIKWEFSYVDSDGEVVIGAIKKRGKKITLKINDLKMLGTTLTIRAFINKRLYSQKIELWIHYRFRWIDRSNLIREVNVRKSNPEKIDQGSTSLCGVAAIGYILAKISFVNYAIYTQNMHQFGKATVLHSSYEIEIDSDEHLLEYKKTDDLWPDSSSVGKMDEADFVFLTTIRDDINFIFDYDPDGSNGGSFSEGGTGITMPRDVRVMMKDVLNFEDVEDDTNTITSKWGFMENILKDIKLQLLLGYHLPLLVEASSFVNKSNTSFSYPNHWVVLTELNYDLTKEEVTYKIFTWGGYRTITNSFDLFKDGYYGFIKGK